MLDERTTARYDRNLAALCAAEPFFAERYQLARGLLESAITGNGGVCYAGGHTCGIYGCSCQDFHGGVECLHAVGYRVYAGLTFQETRYVSP